MSRLIVKNLPPYATTQRLREHFERRDGPGGTLTDVKVAMKPSGTMSRGFGFVGFKTDVEAQKARDWFDKTYVGSTRISVEVVDGARDAPTPRPNKRRRSDMPSDSSALKPKSKADPSTSSLPDVPKPSKKEAELKEFMNTMTRSKKAPAWTNDEPVVTPSLPPSADAPTKKSKKDTKLNLVDEAGVSEPMSVILDLSPTTDVGNDVDAPDPGMSDLDWMKKRMSQAVEIEGKVFDQSGDEAMADDTSDQIHPTIHALEVPHEPEDPIKQTLLSTARLFVRNLAFSCTEDELRTLFEPFGQITQLHIPLDSVSKTPKGFSYVAFADPAHAIAAYEALDRRSFQGRLLHILAAVDKNPRHDAAEDDGKSEGRKTIKAQKGEERKKASGKEFNWAMLYMNSDAVASSIADRLNVSKSDILNPESGSTSAAVKLALAETHVIQETKAYLETQGCDLSVLSSSPDSSSSSTLVPTSRNRRSDTVVLVKNIPYGTSEDAIRALFEPHVEPDSGGLRRVLVPPAGTMAIVEFTRADEAGKAFRAVAYRRIGNSVVYLEKAPLGLLPDGPLQTAPADAGGAKHTSSPTSSATIAKEADEDDETDTKEESVTGATLFVKNLAFATTSEQLMSVLRHLPAFAFARVQTKPDHEDPAGIRRLSMGYGFVGFKDAEGAKRGLKAIQGMRVGGHVLEAKFAGRGAEDDDKDGKGAAGSAGGVTGGRKTTKMIVKNLPFEASKKDVRELFSAHGQLKSVRVPKRFDHRARGFAFLEFLTRQDAEAAYGALQHTHLLGRHLVLEWAAEGEQDLDELRKKAGVGFGDGKELPGKKRKLNMDGDDAGAMDEDA